MKLKKTLTSKVGKCHLNIEIVFSSISLNKNYEIREILEIGTFDGMNALLLSKNFSKRMRTDTIDLNYEDYNFKNFYNRENKVEKFVKNRNNIIKKSNNINFIEMNSIDLINYQKKYDLIWVDGAHGYPVVCIDIINSLRLSNERGLILCDDVYMHKNHDKSDQMYKSIATHETLELLKKQNLINYDLVYKRTGPEYNCIENEKNLSHFAQKNE